MATATLNEFSVFGDEVYTSTDLNRRTGEVLNHARLRPVTISRNDEQFALVRRELAATLFGTIEKLQVAINVLLGVQQALAGEALPPVVSWISIYDKDDIQKLGSEVLNATARAVFGNGDWGQVTALIHEWRESALVAESGVLDAAMYADEQEEIPLPSPEEVMRTTTNSNGACATE